MRSSDIVHHIMKTTVLFLLSCTILAAQAGHLGIGLVGPASHGAILHGPGSKTTLVGPDGSHISAAAAGGAVLAPAQHGGVISAAVVPGYVGVGVGAIGYGGGHGVAGSGLEGQYVHDYSEQLYDDGSYKGDYYDGHDGHY